MFDLKQYDLGLVILFQAAYARFSLDSTTPIIIQCLNDSWGEYIDITNDNEILPGCKYKVILQLPSLLYVEESGQNNELSDVQNLEESASSFNESSNFTTSDELQVIEKPAINLDGPLNVYFSMALNEALNGEIVLSRTLRSELVNIVCKVITPNTKYPSSVTITDAARKIVADYPYLRETIGTGYGGWRQAIRDRLKNIRRFDQSDEVKKRRKAVKATKQNVQPEHPETEITENPETADPGSQFDLPVDLSESFNIRRHEIVVEKMKINDLKIKYPSLFSKLLLEKEYCYVTGQSGLLEKFPHFLHLYKQQCNNLLAVKKKLPIWAQNIKCMLDGSNKKAEMVEEMLILLTLPVHFSEDAIVIAYPVSA